MIDMTALMCWSKKDKTQLYVIMSELVGIVLLCAVSNIYTKHMWVCFPNSGAQKE